MPPLPLAYPTLDHFMERLGVVQRRATDVEGLQDSTIDRWQVGARAFRAFLQLGTNARRFLGGDYREQCTLLEDWIGWLRNSRKISRTSIATYWHSMRAQLARIDRDDGMLNPFDLLEAPKPDELLPRSLTRSQAERLITYVRNQPWRDALERTRNVCLVGLLMLAGLRRGEALRLTVADCNLERGTLLIRLGKGTDGGRTRTSYMSAQLPGMIAEYLDERSRAKPHRTHPELLTAVARDYPMRVTALRRLFRQMTTDLGFKVSPHMLRHTYALLLRQSGVPDRVSMDLLGHRSLAMLQRYSHVFDGEHHIEAAKVVLDLDRPAEPADAAWRTPG